MTERVLSTVWHTNKKGVKAAHSVVEIGRLTATDIARHRCRKRAIHILHKEQGVHPPCTHTLIGTSSLRLVAAGHLEQDHQEEKQLLSGKLLNSGGVQSYPQSPHPQPHPVFASYKHFIIVMIIGKLVLENC